MVPPNLFVLGELIEELPAYVFGKRIPRTGGTAAYRSGIEMGFPWGALPVPGKREISFKRLGRSCVVSAQLRNPFCIV